LVPEGNFESIAASSRVDCPAWLTVDTPIFSIKQIRRYSAICLDLPERGFISFSPAEKGKEKVK
jgi:hypothetical protein